MEKIVRCCGWHESKPIALWCALLDEWKVHAVLDCSPGSGALMEAALTRGIVYHGFCLDLSWLCHMIIIIITSGQRRFITAKLDGRCDNFFKV